MNVQAVTDPRQESNNVVFCLKEKAANSPDTPAMIMPSETITFGELWARVDRFGTGIERAGICPDGTALWPAAWRRVLRAVGNAGLRRRVDVY